MTRRAPDVRRINMLSEYRNPDQSTTTAFYRALSEADEFVREHDRVAELECRCAELTQLVADIRELHPECGWHQSSANWCGTCKVRWPCPTMKLIEGEQ